MTNKVSLTSTFASAIGPCCADKMIAVNVSRHAPETDYRHEQTKSLSGQARKTSLMRMRCMGRLQIRKLAEGTALWPSNEKKGVDELSRVVDYPCEEL